MAHSEQVYCLETLFDQLGLPADSAQIEEFIETHPLAAVIKLAEAEFWSCNQRNFLSQGLKQDAEWAYVIDQLNMLLRIKT